jgi:hypothetical protein
MKVFLQKHSTENHAQNKNMLDINLLRPEKGGDPVRFIVTTFIPFRCSLLLSMFFFVLRNSVVVYVVR